MAELVTDPQLIALLEQAEQGLQRQQAKDLPQPIQVPQMYAQQNAQQPGASPSQPGQRTLADVQQHFSQTGDLPRDNPQQGPSIPAQMLGGAMQGAAAFAPMLANKVPMAAQWLQKLASMGRGGQIAARVAPQALEAGLAGGGSMLQGSDPSTAGMAAATGPMVRAGAYMARTLGRATGNTMFPDQMREAANLTLEKRYGPAVMSRDLYENFVNPNMGAQVGSSSTQGAISKLTVPDAFTRGQAGPIGDFWNLATKYTFGSKGHTVGEMWDDIHALDGTRAVARKQGMYHFAKQIESLQSGMWDDISKQVPQLKEAGTSFAKERRLNDLAQIIKSNTPLDDWNIESKTQLMQKAFPRESDREQIRQIMAMVARQGGGSHYFGKIAGIGLGGLLGLGSGMASGGGAITTGIMATSGMLLPEALGHMLANPGGRAFLKGLIRKNPAGWTPTATNAALQWYNVYRQTGTPAGVDEQ